MTQEPLNLRFDVPRAFKPLLQPRRFKGARGGRGGAKSHFFAERIIQDALTGHHRFACLREYQSSIKESVKLLLDDKIEFFNLRSLFQSTDNEIRCPYDGLVIFKGMSTSQSGRGTATGIKSLEDFDRAFFEEAQVASKRSLELLTPTFRRAGSELSFAWNPNNEKDPIEVFFNDNEGDPDFACVEVNYWDNPWFPDDLRKDMERDKRRDPDKYAHVWCGKYERHSESRVFKNWRIGTEEDFDIAYKAVGESIRFYFGSDWGYSIDPTVLVRCFIIGRTLYVDYEAYRIGCEIDRCGELFEKVPLAHKWPITADNARPETISYMNRHGWGNIKPCIKGANSVQEGIEFLQSYDIVVHPRCKHTIDELSFYSWKTDPKTDEVIPILSDKKNHVIDSLRYAVERARRGAMKISNRVIERAAQKQPMGNPLTTLRNIPRITESILERASRREY